jgi:hypothetical protein
VLASPFLSSFFLPDFTCPAWGFVFSKASLPHHFPRLRISFERLAFVHGAFGENRLLHYLLAKTGEFI